MRDAVMRTTVDLPDDVMLASRDLAARRRTTLGAVMAELLRKGLRDAEPAVSDDDGFVGLPKRGLARPITVEFVNQLREELDT